jgi:hypothetical protein
LPTLANREEIALAVTILTEDFIAICLLLVDGDTTTGLDDVIRAAEGYQRRTNRHFGTSASDFRGILRIGLLLWGLGEDKELEQIELKEAIPEILRFYTTWSNDEGDYWVGKDEEYTTEDYEILGIESYYGYSKKEYSQKLKMKEAMKEFFSKPDSHRHQHVMEFLAKHGIDDTLLVHCSRRLGKMEFTMD